MTKTKTIIGSFVLGFIILFGIQTCNVYNSANQQEQMVKRTWADIQNQYQRRLDLIPNLVNVVKGYATHERTTLENVMLARASATNMKVNPNSLSPESMESVNQAQFNISQSLGRLMVVVEKYPDLKAQEQFMKLQGEISGTENRILVARENYNNSVQIYNTYISKFPANLFNKMLGFKEANMFTAEHTAQNAPTVEF